MNDLLVLVLAVAALIVGLVGIVESRGRDWAAWGVIALAAIVLLGRL